jgi:hypothetical protein
MEDFWDEVIEETHTDFKENQIVEVLWHDGWRRATVRAIRDNDWSVPHGHVRVYIPGPALGSYNLPLNRVRTIQNPVI